jgi:alkaline phosphatase D
MDGNALPKLTRRGFLASTVAAALVACSDSDGGNTDSATTSATTPPTTVTPTTTPSTTSTTTVPATVPTVTSDPFTLGVASGDPLADSVILWTRLLPADPFADELSDVDVEWEVATDPDMSNVVASGIGTAFAALGHSVHVDASGLAPDTDHYYRFMLDGFETTPARTHTFAAAGTTPDRFRFAFSSCQNWEQGYYAAYRELVEQGDIDAFVFLGDYIYEYAADERGRSTGRAVPCRAVPCRSAAQRSVRRGTGICGAGS